MYVSRFECQWIRYAVQQQAFKIKSTKSTARSLGKSLLKLQIIIPRTGVVLQFTKTAIFTAKPMKKYLAVHFFQFVDRKVVGPMSKLYLLAGNKNQFSNFFFLHKIKMSKERISIL